MNKRVRLTKRMAADGSILYPGNVNQPGRTDPAWDEYHTFEQQVNHELPDMRTEWKDDSRDDVGFGIPEANPPTVASVRVAANKAVRIAVLLLGEKVADSVIEAQARDFMSLTQESMDRTLDRFAKTQKLYADEDEGEEEEEKEAKSKKADDDEEDESKKASKALADKGSAVPPAISLKETEVKAEEKKEEEKPAEVKAEKKEIPEFIQKKIDESKEKKSAEEDKKDEEKKEAKVEVKAEEKKDEEKKDEEKKEAKVEVKATDDKDEDDKVEARLAKIEAMIASLATSKKAEDKKEEEKKEAKVEVKAEDEKKEDEKKEAKVEAKADEEEEKEEKKEAKKASPNEMDIELTSSMDDALPADPVADAQLASLFANDGLTAAADEEEKDEAEKKAKAKKAGIKKLGGQPKVAAESGAAVDIGSIWESAPDVSEVFK